MNPDSQELNHRDPYLKLRPTPPVPEDERCSCSGQPAIVLVGSFIACNPIRCFDCWGEVDPAAIGFPEALAEAIAFWNRMYGSIDYLWLESRDYEEWARTELFSPERPPNSRGLLLQKELANYRKCYYWWFQDTGMEDFRPLSRCPVCRRALVQCPKRRICEVCRIVLQGE